MLTSRDIPEQDWDHARRCLVFYFRHRGVRDPEDLAQETLARIWKRDDYSFAHAEDFLRVCYGFAAKVLQQEYRESHKQLLDESNLPAEVPARGPGGLAGPDLPIFLMEVRRIGQSELREGEWDILQKAGSSEGEGQSETGDPREANRLRVRLHRARQRLAQLTGWSKPSRNRPKNL